MATIRTISLIFMFVLYVLSQTNDCDVGWFGSSCQYKCRCAYSVTCGQDGQCPNGRCQRGWFGPACQYTDLASNAQLVLVIDGNDTSCLTPSTSGNTITVFLQRLSIFTWMRVRVSQPEFLYQFTVLFNNRSACPNARNASVDDTTMDFHCDLNMQVQSVTLTGQAVQYLCSVYISGGRNVALRQPTVQSSTYSENSPSTNNELVVYSSNRSVDGNTSGEFYPNGSCSCTNVTSIPNYWSVSFSQPQKVQRYVLYNRDGNADRLIHFRLKSFDVHNTSVFNYTDPSSSAQTNYIVTPSNMTSSVTLVTIVANNQQNFAQICEVEVYAEPDCDFGKYGRNCLFDCNCEGNQTCFISTGGCPFGCKTGFYGASCELECKPGNYGFRCANNCSENCISNGSSDRPCNNVNGFCLNGCLSGYTGDKCNTTCQPGTYGLGCSQTCSQFCVKNESNERSCDHVNGTCLSGCQSGYDGETCSSYCSNGTYGNNCNSSCSQLCVVSQDQSACDHITGWCMFGCVGGFDSMFCKPESGPGGSDKTVIIGAVVGSILAVIFIALIIVAVVFMGRRRNNKSNNKNMAQKTDNYAAVNGGTGATNFVHMNVQPNFDNATVSKHGNTIPEKKTPILKKMGTDTDKNSTLRDPYYNALRAKSQTAVPLNELEDFIATKDTDFFKNQFSDIPANQSATVKEGTSEENRLKNRYKNICAYDHSRVCLIPNVSKKQGDYINASYIEGFKPDEKFIASQGPSKAMLEDFVRMLWEQKVEKVVMLTNLVEDGKQKCEKYWPDDKDLKVGDITIKLTTTQVFADYTIRRLQLRKEDHQSQTLTQFHFTSWPDKDIPNTPWGLVDFEQRVALYPTTKPIVVHCSAGVGRTGTFIALRNVMRQAEETGQMDFFTTVQKLRQDRINMVQTLNQYIFLHIAANVAMLCIGTTVTSRDIQNRIKELDTKTPSGQTRMEKEFKSVCSVCDVKQQEALPVGESTYSNYENSQTVINNLKNREKSILPKELYRASLSLEKPGLGNYINAVLVPSFSKQNHQILTQLPLPRTVTDFWRLVTQYQVNIIVAFDVDLRETDPTIADYLHPTDELTSSLFKVQCEPASSVMNWRQQKVFVSIATDSARQDKLTATEHHVTHLTSTSSVLNKKALMDIGKHIRSLQQRSQDGRCLFMCRDGATSCGLACVLTLLLDRMDYDQCLTVPLVVGALKAVRPEIIPNLEQYKLLYDLLDLYSETINEYSNFGASQS